MSRQKQCLFRLLPLRRVQGLADDRTDSPQHKARGSGCNESCRYVEKRSVVAIGQFTRFRERWAARIVQPTVLLERVQRLVISPS